tara:strand:- start:94821 stop:96248 length:1428 start_codon:yes stop_codon:yes gene_type:complete
MKLSKIAFSIGLLFLFYSCNKKIAAQKPPNILLICIDDLRPELKSFGASYIVSPNIDQLAEKGISFEKHYVNAPSCGPSRYTLLTGQYGPAENDALFKRAKKMAKSPKKIDPSMPEWFKLNGYTTVSVGKVSHHPGGRGGKDWNDSTKVEMPNAWDKHLLPVQNWQHPKGVMHGLANGEIRVKANEMDVFQATEGNDDIYPDGLIANEAITQLKELSLDTTKPFFLAVGIIKPHLPFGAPKKYLDLYENVELPAINHPKKPKGKTTWHNSGEFMKYNRWGKNPTNDQNFANDVRKHYAAAVSYADAQVGKILEELKSTGADKNTIIVLWGDHGWHLGEHAIWGKHSLFEESLHSPLIISTPTLKKVNKKTNAIVETLDIFPTLCDLTDLEIPKFAQGKSLVELLQNPEKKTDYSALSYTKNTNTLRTNSYRLTLHKDGFVELYNHNSSEKETKNIANNQSKLVGELKDRLNSKKK